MNNQTKFYAVHNGETYAFDHGAQLYIFDYALYWDMDKRGRNILKTFVYFVYNCYLKDDNATPLGSLTDYIAENWNSIQEKALGSYDILADFYKQLP